MANVPAEPLEQVIAERLAQLGKQDRTIDHLVKQAISDTSQLPGNLEPRRAAPASHCTRVQDQIDALVEGIAGRRTALKSVSQRILELEGQKEELDDEVLELDLQIEAAMKKVVNAQSLTDSLTTFADFHRGAKPQERQELIRLRVNQIEWTPEEIRLAWLDHPAPQAVTAAQRDATIGSPGAGLIEPRPGLGQVLYISRA